MGACDQEAVAALRAQGLIRGSALWGPGVLIPSEGAPPEAWASSAQQGPWLQGPRDSPPSCLQIRGRGCSCLSPSSLLREAPAPSL